MKENRLGLTMALSMAYQMAVKKVLVMDYLTALMMDLEMVK